MRNYRVSNSVKFVIFNRALRINNVFDALEFEP